MRYFVGMRSKHLGVVVSVLGEQWAEPLPTQLHLRNHSPDGFEWGYQGSGPAQLALAILVEVMRDENAALRLYQRFKRQIVAKLPKPWWLITEASVQDWVAHQIANSAALEVPDTIELGDVGNDAAAS